MAFTATINTINFQSDTWNIGVTFNDSASSWTSTKQYTFPSGSTQAQVINQITADGNTYKTALTLNSALQSKVGTVITI